MKQFIIAVSFFISISSYTQEKKLENSTLWKIEGKDLESPSYLFGTIHITCEATLDEEVKRALQETKQLVLEIDMDDPEMQKKMVIGMNMKDGKKLRDLVSEKELALIDTLFTNEMGMSVKMFQTVKPGLLYAMFLPKMLDCNSNSYEAVLMNNAKDNEEEILGLETVKDQMNIFEIIPYEEQVKNLVKTAKDGLQKDKEMLKELQEVYQNEDISGLLELMNDEEYNPLKDYDDVMLSDRNENWIPKIIEFANDKPTFFGVGAGHLAGEKGVINLLRAKGYTVTPVME